jgi:hypothetical protein
MRIDPEQRPRLKPLLAELDALDQRYAQRSDSRRPQRWGKW